MGAACERGIIAGLGDDSGCTETPNDRRGEMKKRAEKQRTWPEKRALLFTKEAG